MNDDFDQLYTMRQQHFQQGVREGQQQADTYNFEEAIVEAKQFANEFAKQIACYRGYVQAQKEIGLKQSVCPKARAVFEDIQKGINALDYSDLSRLKEQRQALSKSFRTLMATLGIKKAAHKTGKLQSLSNNDSLDF